MAAVAVVGSMCVHISGRAAQLSNIQVVRGTCGSSSHTAEGPLGSDLTKRQSRFYCDLASIAFFDDYKGHVMIDFVEKEAHHGPTLGFAGRLSDDGITMAVDHVYLPDGPPTTVSDGACKFFFKNHHLSGIFCGMIIDETGRRTAAAVVFNAAPGQ
jgi:hypothetical protein